MNYINEITKPIENELLAFEKYFSAAIKSNIPLLSYVTGIVLKRKSRQLRPLLMLLTAKNSNNKINEPVYITASLAELMYTATLIHRDVTERIHEKGLRPSIKNFWKSKVSVLLGDFLLSKGLLLAMDYNQFLVLEILSSAIKDHVESAFIKKELLKKNLVTFDEYHDFAHKKTESFITACFKASALGSGYEERNLESIIKIGTNLGIACHIKEDITTYEKIQGSKHSKIHAPALKLLLPVVLGSQNDHSNKVNITLNSLKINRKEFIELNETINGNNGLEKSHTMLDAYLKKVEKEIHGFQNPQVKKSFNLLITNFLKINL